MIGRCMEQNHITGVSQHGGAIKRGCLAWWRRDGVGGQRRRRIDAKQGGVYARRT